MLGIQFSALSVPELKRLLGLARARGQEGLARRLEAELTVRLGRGVAGQPLPMSVTPPIQERAPSSARRTRGPAIAVAGLAAFIGATVAWGVSLEAPQPPRSQPSAVVDPSPAPRINVALTSTTLPEEAPTQPMREPAAPPIEVEPTERATQARHDNPCLDLPTAHARLICGYPSLANQDRRMKAALERARAVSDDPDALDSAQAAWQGAITNVSDRQVVGERYAQRIAELDAEAR
jgi:hypothetical protein